jgi:hypothetical protein
MLAWLKNLRWRWTFFYERHRDARVAQDALCYIEEYFWLPLSGGQWECRACRWVFNDGDRHPAGNACPKAMAERAQRGEEPWPYPRL